MDISAIISRLQAQCPTLAQVIEAKTGGTQALIGSQASIYSLISATVAGNMYPLQLPEQPTHPSIVYQMVSSTPGVFEGYDVTHTDLFILNVRHADYDALLVLVQAIITALSSANVEITDSLHDYDQSENVYRVNLEVSYSYLTAASQSMPAAFVYPLTMGGDSSAFDNYTKQRVDADYAILIVTDDGNVVALHNEIMAALLGWQQGADHHEMEYSNGSAIEGVGGLEVWRDVYRDAYYIEQA